MTHKQVFQHAIKEVKKSGKPYRIVSAVYTNSKYVYMEDSEGFEMKIRFSDHKAEFGSHDFCSFEHGQDLNSVKQYINSIA